MRQFLRSSCDPASRSAPDLTLVCKDGRSAAHKFAILAALPDLAKLFCGACLHGHDAATIILPDTSTEAVNEARDLLYMYGDGENFAKLFGMRRVKEKIPLNFAETIVSPGLAGSSSKLGANAKLMDCVNIAGGTKAPKVMSLHEKVNMVQKTSFSNKLTPIQANGTAREYQDAKGMYHVKKRQKRSGAKVELDTLDPEISVQIQPGNASPDQPKLKSSRAESVRGRPRRGAAPRPGGAVPLLTVRTSGELELSTAEDTNTIASLNCVASNKSWKEIEITAMEVDRSTGDWEITKVGDSAKLNSIFKASPEIEITPSPPHLAQTATTEKLVLSNSDEFEFIGIVEDGKQNASNSNEEQEYVNQVEKLLVSNSDAETINQKDINMDEAEVPLNIKSIDFDQEPKVNLIKLEESQKSSSNAGVALKKGVKKLFSCENCPFTTKYRTVLKEHQRREAEKSKKSIDAKQ